MKLSSKILIILYGITFFGYSATEEVTVEVESESTENDTFVPTKEWQIIKEGQSVPPGLHIRLNLETGVREAKILDEKENENQNENENKNTQLNVLPDDIQSNSEGEGGTDTLMTKTLKDAVKKANESPEQIEWISQEEEERIKKTYKDYKQLKKDYDEMKSNFKTDMEIITELLDEFNHTKDDDSTSNIINLLNDLNYLVHQIDNALWFIDSGGLNSLVLPMVVNQTYLPYRIASLRLLGALTQNNPKAQIKVYENNFGSYISNILLQSSDTDELSTAVYAFGSILRKFPIAQKEILSQSGTKALISVLQKNIDLKVKAKVLTLISDLIIDKENVLQINDSDITDLEKLNQYAEVNLLQWLTENQYCSTVIEFITESYLDIIRKPDIADDLIESMNTTNSSCQKLWSENYNFMKILKSIEVNFLNSGNEYQVEIGEKIQSLILSLGDKYEMNRKKDEL